MFGECTENSDIPENMRKLKKVLDSTGGLLNRQDNRLESGKKKRSHIIQNANKRAIMQTRIFRNRIRNDIPPHKFPGNHELQQTFWESSSVSKGNSKSKRDQRAKQKEIKGPNTPGTWFRHSLGKDCWQKSCHANPVQAGAWRHLKPASFVVCKQQKQEQV